MNNIDEILEADRESENPFPIDEQWLSLLKEFGHWQ
jgi:hypothetical protein